MALLSVVFVGGSGQPVAIPAGAQAAVFFATWYTGLDSAFSGVSLTGAATFQVAQQIPGTLNNLGQVVATAVITAPGTTGTLTFSFVGAVNIGPVVAVAFVNEINTSDYVRATAAAVGVNSAAVSQGVTSQPGDIVLAFNSRYSYAPTAPSGWTEQASGTDGASERAMVSRLNVVPSGTAVYDAVQPYFDTLGLVSIKQAAAAVAHAAAGVLAGQGAATAGTARRTRAHGTSGVLTGVGAAAVGASARLLARNAIGVLTGPGATTGGAATRTRQHGAAGVLAGAGAAVIGASARLRAGGAAGALAGAGGSLAGAAVRARAFAGGGALAGAAAATAGAAARTRAHGAAGVLAGAGAATAGASTRAQAGGTIGALAGAGGSVAGAALRTRAHGAAGVLSSLGASTVGTAAHWQPSSVGTGPTCRVGVSLVPDACHVGARGLGMLGAEIMAATAIGEHGAGLMINDGLAADREYRLVITASTFAPDALVVYEDGSVEYTAAGTATQALYEANLLVGTAALSASFASVQATLAAVLDAITGQISVGSQAQPTEAAVDAQLATLEGAITAASAAQASFAAQLESLQTSITAGVFTFGRPRRRETLRPAQRTIGAQEIN